MKESKMGVMQAASVIVTVMIAHIILNMPNHLIASTGSSTILNLAYIFIISIVIFYLASKIFALFPGKDLMDICEFAGGKFLKNIFRNYCLHIFYNNFWIRYKNFCRKLSFNIFSKY